MTTRPSRDTYDAIVVGSGPNGLAAAITLAREGKSVLVLEANDTIGGGARSAELTLPGFVHDVCSAIHPLAIASPFFRSLPLQEHGLEWIHPAAPLAHPLDDGTAAMIERSVDVTAESLGEDGPAYRKLVGRLVDASEGLFGDILHPLRVPRHLLTLMRFGFSAVRSAKGLAERWWKTERAQALFAGLAGHAILPLDESPSAAAGLVLAIAAHAVGWPMPRGGSQKITDALASYLRSLGGEIVAGRRITNVEELPKARVVLLDITPRQVIEIAGQRLRERYRRKLERYRYGPGAFKIDLALSQPIPWKAGETARAATVHLGGSLGEIAASERAVWNGELPERPYILVAQQSLFDSSRAPAGQHTCWAYCHVPNGSTFDMTQRIEAQIERYAPGFRDCILARHVMSPAELQRGNANYIGGDINGGAQDWKQLFTRPVARLVPYKVPKTNLYICSSSTPPGGGVHGMCGFLAAQAALRVL